MSADEFFICQLERWQEATERYAALDNVKVKSAGGFMVQYNPARIVSTGAKTDAMSIGMRPCFLCRNNRPKQQIEMEWGGGRYEILVNPFPISSRHFTIAATEHIPQCIGMRIVDMLRLAFDMPGYTVFFNGAHCGASAPDHLHFQAVRSEFLPIWDSAIVPHLRIEGRSVAETAERFERIASRVDCVDMNLLCRADGDVCTLIVIPRHRHRPSFYGDKDDDFLISPASIDLGGVIITPRKRDFERINADVVKRMIEEVCYTDEEIKELRKLL